MRKRCLTCEQEKPLTDYWIEAADGRATPAAPAKHCIACHEAERVPNGYGAPGVKWKSPMELNAWIGCLEVQHTSPLRRS